MRQKIQRLCRSVQYRAIGENTGGRSGDPGLDAELAGHGVQGSQLSIPS
jgi:hypothetical protein